MIEDAIDFTHLPQAYWSKTTQMSYLQRRIIVYSIMYYEQNESCVSDRYYDSVSQQLVKMLKQYPDDYEKTTYYYAMYDFDGSTGFDIPDRLTKKDREYLILIASHVYRQWKENTTPTQRRKQINDKVKGFR